MKKLEDFKGALFTKEAMKKVNGGLADATKTRLTGTTTTVDGVTSLEHGDTSNVD